MLVIKSETDWLIEIELLIET